MKRKLFSLSPEKMWTQRYQNGQVY